jgi:hypothetical protein
MEQKQINPERIKAVGWSIVAILVTFFIYGCLAIMINHNTNIKDVNALLATHYTLLGIFGFLAFFFIIRICVNLIRCTEK